MESNVLNKYSDEFKRVLLPRFPFLSEYTKPTSDETLLVEYCPLEKRPDVLLWISTENDEVTIGFGEYHCHFYWPENNTGDPLVFLENLISDKLIIEVRSRNGKWIGTSTAATIEAFNSSQMKEGDVFKYISWSGSLDKIVQFKSGAA